MRYRQPIIKLVSIVMIFVLIQKVAGGLYLHNWLHTSKETVSLSHGGKAIGQYNCSCIDDFYVPFTEPLKLSVQVPIAFHADFFISPIKELPVISKYFHSLRAPPAV